MAFNNVKKSNSRIKKRSSFLFSPKINLLLLALAAVGTFITVAALQQQQDIRQQASSTNVPAPKLNLLEKSTQPIPVELGNGQVGMDGPGGGQGVGQGNTVPNPVCGGSGQGSVCPSMGQPQTGNNPGNPNQGNPNQGPNQNQPWNPNPSNAPGQIAPGEPNPNGGNNGGGNGGGNNGGNTNNGLLQRIIEMLNQILQMLQQLLGGGNPNPNQPNPNQPNPNNPNPNNPNPNQPNPNQPGPSQPNQPNPNQPGPSQPNQPNPNQPSTAPSAATGDTTPPSTPTNLRAVSSGNTTINLTWNASTDNVAVTYYMVYRSEGDAGTPGGNTGITWSQRVNGTSFSNTGLTAGKSYYYYVRAFDAANNKSEHSNTAGVTLGGATKPNSLKVTVGLSGQSSLKDKRITIQVTGTGYSKSTTQGNTVNKTDSYTFTGIPNGKYSLHISYGTYKSVNASITFDKSGGNETISKSYTLAK